MSNEDKTRPVSAVSSSVELEERTTSDIDEVDGSEYYGPYNTVREMWDAINERAGFKIF